MFIRQLTLDGIEADWPRLQELYAAARPDAGKKRLRDLLSAEGSYALLAEHDGVPAGLAVVGHYQNAWIFDDSIAAVREFAVPGAGANEALLSEIEQRSRAAEMTHLSRFTAGDDPLLPWWQEAGFFEYMAAFRRAIDDAPASTSDAEAGTSARPEEDDGIAIRAVSDLDADWPKLWPLLAGLQEHHASLTGSRLKANREESDRSETAEELQGGESLIMLAEVDGHAVATSSAELGARHTDGTRTGYRSKLFVDPAYRGRGLTARFEAAAVPWFREHGVTHVERWIVAGNERPRQIWSARGYKPDHVLLRRRLQP